MPHNKPEPIFPFSQPNLCPVCGKASYSANGIHPQCAVNQADEKRQLHLKQVRSDAKAAKKKPDAQKQTSLWQKTCPQCQSSQHVRKKICDCGHTFAKFLPKGDSS